MNNINKKQIKNSIMSNKVQLMKAGIYKSNAGKLNTINLILSEEENNYQPQKSITKNLDLGQIKRKVEIVIGDYSDEES